MKNSFLSYLMKAGMALVFTAVLLVGLTPATAQVPSSNPPYNTDIGAVLPSAQRTQAVGTYSSASQTNLDKEGVVCTLVPSASSGSPSTTFNIQEYDAASATWFTVKTSTAILSTEAPNTPHQLVVRPSVQTTSDPTNSDSLSWPLTRVWRVQGIVGNGAGAAGPAMTFQVGCNYVR